MVTHTPSWRTRVCWWLDGQPWWLYRIGYRLLDPNYRNSRHNPAVTFDHYKAR